MEAPRRAEASGANFVAERKGEKDKTAVLGSMDDWDADGEPAGERAFEASAEGDGERAMEAGDVAKTVPGAFVKPSHSAAPKGVTSFVAGFAFTVFPVPAMPEGIEEEKTQELNVNLLAVSLDTIEVAVFAKMQFSIIIPLVLHLKTAPALFRELFQKFEWLTDRTVSVYCVSPMDE
jgi:hypothetical protein